MNPTIVTAQPFFNELDLLELKVRELEGIVDAHVIVEAPLTFSGIEKPMHFLRNSCRFTGMEIYHFEAELPREAPSPWIREGLTHRRLFEAVRELKPDVVIWVDTDELPRRDVVERFLAMNVEVATLELDVLLFGFDRLDFTQTWRKASIAKFRPTSRQLGRGELDHPVIKDAGWHLEYFGQRDELMAKLHATSHAPEPGAHNMRRLVQEGQLPGIERTVFYPASMLPTVVQADRAKFARHFTGI